MFPVILAHGSLGSFDEIILLGIVIAFIGVMGFIWWRSRREPANDQSAAAKPSDGMEPVSSRDSTETADHFRLD